MRLNLFTKIRRNFWTVEDHFRKKELIQANYSGLPCSSTGGHNSEISYSQEGFTPLWGY